MPLRDQWSWNDNYLKLYLVLPAIIAIVLSAILYPSQGLYSLYFLLFIPTGVVFWFIYAAVGKKVSVLMSCKSALNGEAVESLLVIGKIQSPGIAILRPDVLILIPIVGRRRKYKLENILSIKQSNWLPGKFVWGKTAFHLQTTGTTKIAFAVSESVGELWCSKLRQ
jgi:hypothetical protein